MLRVDGLLQVDLLLGLLQLLSLDFDLVQFGVDVSQGIGHLAESDDSLRCILAYLWSVRALLLRLEHGMHGLDSCNHRQCIDSFDIEIVRELAV